MKEPEKEGETKKEGETEKERVKERKSHRKKRVRGLASGGTQTSDH